MRQVLERASTHGWVHVRIQAMCQAAAAGMGCTWKVHNSVRYTRWALASRARSHTPTQSTHPHTNNNNLDVLERLLALLQF